MPVRQHPSSGQPKQPSLFARAIGGGMARELQQELDQGDREQVSDQALIIRTPAGGNPQHEMEMQRRLKDAVEALTAETITARDSSERLTRQLDASVVSLTAETVKAAKASDRAARWLIGLTVGLLLLTLALVGLTVALLVIPPDHAATDPAPAPSHSARQIRARHSSPDPPARSTRHGKVRHKPAPSPDASPGS